MPHITDDRHAQLLKIEHVMKIISSCSPKVDNIGTQIERRCALCHALIDEARGVLGYWEWPAVPHTPKPSCITYLDSMLSFISKCLISADEAKKARDLLPLGQERYEQQKLIDYNHGAAIRVILDGFDELRDYLT